MKWATAATQQDGTVMAIKSDCGNYHISKAFLDGCTLYVAWHGNNAIKYAEDLGEAKSACVKYSGSL